MNDTSAVICTKIGPFEDVLKIGSIPRPKVRKGFLKIKVLSCGVAFPDVLTIEGNHIFKPSAPFVPCREIAGVVLEVGDDVSGFQIGDRVFGGSQGGGLQTEALILAKGAYHIPDGVDMHVSAGFELNYGTTWHGLIDLAKLKKGETVLVLGASGGVGMSAIDIAQAMGCKIVACASTSYKLECCKKAGANILINYTEGGPKGFKKALKKAGVYGKVDVVYDPVGGDLSEIAMRAMGWGGRFVVIGFAAGGAVPKNAIPKFPLNLALLNERSILGCFWGAWKARTMNQGNRTNIETMLAWVKENRLKPVISKTYAFENYLQAMKDIMSRRVVGKITIAVGNKNSSKL